MTNTDVPVRRRGRPARSALARRRPIGVQLRLDPEEYQLAAALLRQEGRTVAGVCTAALEPWLRKARATLRRRAAAAADREHESDA